MRNHRPTIKGLDQVEERYQRIAARCLEVRNGTGQCLAVCAPARGDGVSSVTVGIAGAVARNRGADVLIVETDMERPVLADDFELAATPGLSDFLSSGIDLEVVLQKTKTPHLWLLPAGTATGNPGPLLRSARFEELLVSVRHLFCAVVIDTPPLLTSPHASLIASKADGLVIVVRASRTHVHELASAIERVGSTPIRGVVLNRTKRWLPAWLSTGLGISRFELQ